MCVENYPYSTRQNQHKQTIKYNKSINHKNNYFLLYKKVLFTHLTLKKSNQIKIYKKPKKYYTGKKYDI